MPRKAKRPQILQVIGGGYPNLFPSLPNMTPSAPAQPNSNSNANTPDPLSATLMTLGSNPYLIGLFYMFLNLGGRFLSLELTKRQEWFLSQPYVRPFILFAVLFIATRNLAVALYTSIFILSVLWLFANENSVLCLIPSWRTDKTDHVTNDKAYTAAMNKLQKTKGHDSHDDHNEPNHEDNQAGQQEQQQQQQQEQQQQNSPTTDHTGDESNDTTSDSQEQTANNQGQAH